MQGSEKKKELDSNTKQQRKFTVAATFCSKPNKNGC
jgi:hypothetical protein